MVRHNYQLRFRVEHPHRVEERRYDQSSGRHGSASLIPQQIIHEGPSQQRRKDRSGWILVDGSKHVLPAIFPCEAERPSLHTAPGA